MNFKRPVGSDADLEPDERIALAEETKQKETTMLPEPEAGLQAQPGQENIYLKQIKLFTNAVDEIKEHVNNIEQKASIFLAPPPAEKSDSVSGEVPPVAVTTLSECLAILGTHIAQLDAQAQSVEERITV